MEKNELEERCNSLAEKLSAMLDEKLGDGWSGRAWASDKRTISLLFGIIYAHNLNEIREEDESHERFAGFLIAGRAGLASQTYGPLIHAGQDLAQYVDVKGEGENQPVAAGPESTGHTILDVLLSIRRMLDLLEGQKDNPETAVMELAHEKRKLDEYLDALREDE